MLHRSRRPPRRPVAPPPTLEWMGDHIRLIDQRRLPGRLVHLKITRTRQLVRALRTLAVRGAPAIGVAAALGVALAAVRSRARTTRELARVVDQAAAELAASRPTAVNLFHALQRMSASCADGLARGESAAALRRRLVARAVGILKEDQALCRRIGRHGARLFRDGDVIQTHCNAGALATAGLGTALAPLYYAAARGRRLKVIVDETRPLLQGARLTAWELAQAGLDATLICDNMAAAAMRRLGVTAVIVGADRIAANGDTANKIGTCGLAFLARAHGLPFYVAAPSTTFDPACPDGSRIPIEERDPREVTRPFGRPLAPKGIRAWNPAFDVTPAELITAFVTERGVLRPPFARAIRGLLKSVAATR